MSKKHALLVGVLAVGLTALVGDRLFFAGSTGPQTASAETAVVDTPVESTDPLVTTLRAGSPQPTGPSIGDRLTEVTERLGVDPERPREAFKPAEAWMVRAGGVAAVKNAEPDNDVQRAEQFERDHRFSGAMTHQGRTVAIVDGNLLSFGHVVDGFKLVEVRPRSVIFASGLMRVELKLSPDR